MRTLKRISRAFCLFGLGLLIASAVAHATQPHDAETAQVNVYPNQQIRSFAQQVNLPPNPWNPSGLSKYIEQFEAHQSAHTDQGMYFDIETASVPVTVNGKFTFERGYQIEAAGILNGVFVDPLLYIYGFPGDQITVFYFGPGDPTAIGNGAPFIELNNNNASGMLPSAVDSRLNYTAPYLDTIAQPYLDMQADPTWSPFLLSGKRNCWGDLPAANEPNNYSVTTFMDYYTTADGVVHWATFQPPLTPQDPAFVDKNGHSLPGCGLTVSTYSSGGVTYSTVTSYGGGP